MQTQNRCMSLVADAILNELQVVEDERSRRVAEPSLAASVARLKSYQQQRFRRTYADLLLDPRYAGAAAFFLDELYGPHDFTARDAQFARIVPSLVRLFPSELVDTVRVLTALHALSERFDTEMGRYLLDTPSLDARAYLQAWQSIGRPAERERQIDLLIAVGRSLDVYTRHPVLRHTLRLMRGPARAAGLGDLQAFLERGFECFRSMGGASHFLEIVQQREQELMSRLFAGSLAPGAEGCDVLGQLP